MHLITNITDIRFWRDFKFPQFMMLNLFVLLSISVGAQTKMDQAYNNVYWAEILQKQGNHTEALQYFDKAFNLSFIDDSYYMIDAAYSAFKIGDNEKAKCYLSKTISDYNVPFEFLIDNYKLKDYKNSPIIKEVLDNYNDLKGDFYKNRPNIDAYIKIEKIRETDQLVRTLPNPNSFNSEHEELLKDYNNYIIDSTDSLNAQILMDLTKKYGYFNNGYIILWHQRLGYPDNIYWKFFKPFLQNEIEKGNLRRFFFAEFEDLRSQLFNFNQIYGTNAYYDTYPIQDIQNVDQKRKEIGLPPLKYMNYIYGYPLPKEYSMTEEELFVEMKDRLDNE